MTLSTLTTVNDDVLAELKAEMALRRTKEVFLLFGFGSQTDGKIRIELDRLRVFCIMGDPASLTAEEVQRLNPKGIILSGGPISIHKDELAFDREILDLGIPVLGICLGAQVIAHYMGATIDSSQTSEYGPHIMERAPNCPLFRGIEAISFTVLQSHTDTICISSGMMFPTGDVRAWGWTSNALAAFSINHLWGIQFHPEVHDTMHGSLMLENFCFGICGASDRFPARQEAEHKIEQIRREVGGAHVFMALSGGNDSNVSIELLHRAGCKISAMYIKGADRDDDANTVQDYYGELDWLDLYIVDATPEFLAALVGVTTWDGKRQAMRGVYKAMIEEKAAEVGAEFIAQGTLYTDISESGAEFRPGQLIFLPSDHAASTTVRKGKIKRHHNTGLDFSLPEVLPVADCVKDTARNIGRELGIPESLLMRHPFPGPGPIVRIVGEVTEEKLAMHHAIDAIYIQALRDDGLYDKIWQAGVVITETLHSVQKGDERGEGVEVVLWAVNSIDGFTATPYPFDWEWLFAICTRIANEVPGVGAVTYRCTSKPPSTIEFG